MGLGLHSDFLPLFPVSRRPCLQSTAGLESRKRRGGSPAGLRDCPINRRAPGTPGWETLSCVIDLLIFDPSTKCSSKAEMCVLRRETCTERSPIPNTMSTFHHRLSELEAYRRSSFSSPSFRGEAGVFGGRTSTPLAGTVTSATALGRPISRNHGNRKAGKRGLSV